MLKLLEKYATSRNLCLSREKNNHEVILIIWTMMTTERETETVPDVFYVPADRIQFEFGTQTAEL